MYISLFLGTKGPERSAEHTHLQAQKLRMGWSCTSPHLNIRIDMSWGDRYL